VCATDTNAMPTVDVPFDDLPQPLEEISLQHYVVPIYGLSIGQPAPRLWRIGSATLVESAGGPSRSRDCRA
jgi:hypothetical protein